MEASNDTTEDHASFCINLRFRKGWATIINLNYEVEVIIPIQSILADYDHLPFVAEHALVGNIM